MTPLDLIAPALTFAAGWLLARRRYGAAYIAAVQADLAALRALIDLSHSRPEPLPGEGASEARSGQTSLSNCASPERSSGAAFCPDWEGKPLVSIAVALALPAPLWAGIVAGVRAVF